MFDLNQQPQAQQSAFKLTRTEPTRFCPSKRDRLSVDMRRSFNQHHSILLNRSKYLFNKTRLNPKLFNNAAPQLNTLAITPNDCSMDFVLGGIAYGLGYATLTIYTT